MAWTEARAWQKGNAHQDLYQALLDDAATAPTREQDQTNAGQQCMERDPAALMPSF